MQCNCKLLVKCFAAQYCLVVFITFTLYVLEYRNNFLSSSVAATKTIKTARKIINACERPALLLLLQWLWLLHVQFVHVHVRSSPGITKTVYTVLSLRRSDSPILFTGTRKTQSTL